jgi:hypothetical protein
VLGVVVQYLKVMLRFQVQIAYLVTLLHLAAVVLVQIQAPPALVGQVLLVVLAAVWALQARQVAYRVQV